MPNLPSIRTVKGDPRMAADMTAAEAVRDERGVRIAMFDPETMSDEQRKVYEAIMGGPRKSLIGPLRAVLHSPDLADRWQRLGEYVRYMTCIPPRLKELAILATARRWNSDVEWSIHRGFAESSGFDTAIIEAVKEGRFPDFGEDEQREVYTFAQEILNTGHVRDDAYAAVRRRWGDRGVVELTSIIGYYSMVAMMLNAHHVPLPPGVNSNLGEVQVEAGLFELPAAPTSRAQGGQGS